MAFIRHLFSSNKDLSNAIKNVTGFYPSNIAYYQLAFIHSSVAKENERGFLISNERLEFLGDSILGAVIAEYLYKRFPNKDEGFLSKMKSKIVGKESLSALAKNLGLDTLLNAKLDHISKSKSANEDVFEALLGAIYLDKGYDTVKDFLLKRIIKLHLDIDEIEATDNDFKSRIIEYSQKKRMTHEFVLVSETGKGYDKQYEIHLFLNEQFAGKGLAHSKKRAEQMASQEALERL